MTVRVEGVPCAVGLAEAGLNVQETPLGNSEQLSRTEFAKPSIELTVTTAVADSPALTELGEVESGTVISKSPMLKLIK